MMKQTVHAFSIALKISFGCLASFGAWCNPDAGDQQYIQQYCEQTYGSVYYEQESERAKAIKDCVDEQSQYFSQDEAPKQDAD